MTVNVNRLIPSLICLSYIGLLGPVYGGTDSDTERYLSVLRPIGTSTPLEKKYAKRWPAQMLLVEATRVEALEETMRVYGRIEQGKATDAFFHFLWAGLATMESSITEDGNWSIPDVEAVVLVNAYHRKPGTAASRMDLRNEGHGYDAAIRLFQKRKLTKNSLSEEGQRLVDAKKLRHAPKGRKE